MGSDTDSPWIDSSKVIPDPTIIEIREEKEGRASRQENTGTGQGCQDSISFLSLISLDQT